MRAAGLAVLALLPLAGCGGDAWVGIFADRTSGDELCIRVTAHPHAFGSDVDVEVDRCMGAGV